NVELAQKNVLITQQKQEITDSIHYAKRIQTGLLPPEEHVSADMPEHFVLFKPKDIVSGDFHWATKKDGYIIITAADCTGHGVPGAFMSMLGVSFLNEIVNDKGITASNEILNNLREYVISALQQTGKQGEQKDWMDMALCSLDKNNGKLQFSGANNPLYLIRNGELTETKGDKMPVAIHLKMADFTRHDIAVQPGDTFYMFSDGFADQFGGPAGKKFKYIAFKSLLLEIRELPMKEQKQRLDKAISEWMAHVNRDTGEVYEQIDDICVIGIRIG
ncbi:MAG: serine/threonine-protein phosphatase, partial [Bacteroidetes bacterium]|nr:serine/threonine-protein phosphatase [Bacteroidota bacterium]